MSTFRLRRVEAGTYESPDRSWRIVLHSESFFNQDRWYVFTQVPGEKSWHRDEREFVRKFDTLREARAFVAEQAS